MGSVTCGREHVVTDVPWVVALEHFSFSDPMAFIYVAPCPTPSRSTKQWGGIGPKGGVGTCGLTAACSPQAKHFEPVFLKLESVNIRPGI